MGVMDTVTDSFGNGLTKVEAINNFIFYLDILKKKSIVSKADFRETSAYRKMMNIYSLTSVDEKLMEVLWDSGQYVFDKEEIKKAVADKDMYLVPPTLERCLKSLVEKKYLLKSCIWDGTRPLFKRIRLVYSIIVPYELYSSKLDEVIDMIIKDTDMLYVGITKESLEETQAERIRRICNGEDLD